MTAMVDCNLNAASSSSDCTDSESGEEQPVCGRRCRLNPALPYCMVAQADNPTFSKATVDLDQSTEPLGGGAEASTDTVGGKRPKRLLAEQRAQRIQDARRESGRKITHSDLWAVLSPWRCAKGSRLGKDTGPPSVATESLGLVPLASKRERWCISPRTYDFPELCQLLSDFLRQQLGPDMARLFSFSTITINEDIS